MARIRFIKPGFFDNEDLCELHPLARLLFAGLWTLADREGRLEDRPKRIKADVLPYDDAVDIDELLDALDEYGFIVRYIAEGERYIEIVKFHKHQHPHRREAASTIPAWNEKVHTKARADTRLGTHHDAPGHDQGTTKASTSRVGNEIQVHVHKKDNTYVVSGKGQDRDSPGQGQAPTKACTEQVREVFAYWQAIMNSPRSALDAKRTRLIAAALKLGYSVADLKRAIDGCRVSPFHMGQNEKGTKFNGLDLIMRNAEKIDQFIAFADAPPKLANGNGNGTRDTDWARTDGGIVRKAKELGMSPRAGESYAMLRDRIQAKLDDHRGAP